MPRHQNRQADGHKDDRRLLQADAGASHVNIADESWLLGPPPARESYLAIDRIIQIARRSGAQAVHPGYGFLSENAQFVESCVSGGPDLRRTAGVRHATDGLQGLGQGADGARRRAGRAWLSRRRDGCGDAERRGRAHRFSRADQGVERRRRTRHARRARGERIARGHHRREARGASVVWRRPPTDRKIFAPAETYRNSNIRRRASLLRVISRT